MKRLNPWTFGLALSITVIVNYVLCALIWFAFPISSMRFLNALFHGVDFNRIYAMTAFSFGDFLYVLIVLSIWAYLLGMIYAITRNWVKPDSVKI